MNQEMTTMGALDLWYKISCRTMKEMRCDFSPRQMNILLTVYLTKGPHSIKSLSEGMTISKPAVCRALDTLSIAGLVKRKKDEQDRRNVYVQRTIQGSVFLSDFADIVMQEWGTELDQKHKEREVTVA